MRDNILLIALLLAPFISGAPSSSSPVGSAELSNSTAEHVEPETAKPLEPETPKPETTEPEVSKASATASQSQVPFPFTFSSPFSLPFPFAFPPAPAPHSRFPNVFQVFTIPRPQTELQDDDEEEEELAVFEEIDAEPEGRRAQFSIKKKKQKKQKKPKKQKKQKKQKKPNNNYPAPIVIYQNQEPLGPEGVKPPMMGAQGAQNSYMGYYMLYVVEVRWTGNNYTQTVVTGRPIPAAITIPTSTEPGSVNSLSETILPANLVNRPQPTPTCFFRTTTTEHLEPPTGLVKPDNFEENVGENQEQTGEEEGGDEDEEYSAEEEYEDESDPKKKRKKKKKKTGILELLKPPTNSSN